MHLNFFQRKKMIGAPLDCHFHQAVVCTQSTQNTLPPPDWHFFCLWWLFGQISKPLLRLLLPHHELLCLFRPFHLNPSRGLIAKKHKTSATCTCNKWASVYSGRQNVTSLQWVVLTLPRHGTYAKVTYYVTSQGCAFASAGQTLRHLLSA